VVCDAPLDAEGLKRFKAALGKGNKAADAKFVLNQAEKKETFNKENLRQQSTLYFKGCRDCEYLVESKCVKVLIESCENVKFSFTGVIVTSIVELWKCQSIDISIRSKVQTLQVDMSKKITVNYLHRDMMNSIVWAGVHDFSISIPNGIGGRDTIDTGFANMMEVYPDIKEDYDQFIVRVVEGKLVSEQVVRLENGFPTTEREEKAWDEKDARNKIAAEKHIRKLVKTVEMKHTTAKKPGRNEACTCGSGHKYKKCCGK